MQNSTFPGQLGQDIFCQTTSTYTNAPYVTKSTALEIWNQKWNITSEVTYFMPVLLSCQLPKGNLTDYKLFLSNEPCKVTSTNHVRAISAKTRLRNDKKRPVITVCVKPLNFLKDMSKALVAWIEMIKILGANRIEMFIDEIHGKTEETLNWYKKTHNEVVFVKKFKCIAHGTNISLINASAAAEIWQKRLCEVISYNDCFYRNVHSSEYVLPLDVDEIIVPRKQRTWQNLLGTISSVSEGYVSFTVRNAYYLSRFTENKKTALEPVPFFRDVTRSQFSEAGESGKSFIPTKTALTVFNHYALHAIAPGAQRIYHFDTEVAQMNHYKDDCLVKYLPDCARYINSAVRVRDPIIYKYRKEFKRRYFNILNELENYY